MDSTTIVIGDAAATMRVGIEMGIEVSITVTGTTMPTATSTAITAIATSTGVSICVKGIAISADMHTDMDIGLTTATPAAIGHVPMRRTGTLTAERLRRGRGIEVTKGQHCWPFSCVHSG